MPKSLRSQRRPVAGHAGAGGSETIWFARAVCLLFLILGWAGVQAQAVVSLTFDDGFEHHAEVARLLERYGMRATFYINSARIGQPGYLSREQVRAMVQAGHEIGGHTRNHFRLTALSLEEAEREICDDRRALAAMEIYAVSFAWPFGAETTVLQALPGRCGYDSARDVGGLWGSTGCIDCPRAESLPPGNAYAIRTPDSVRSSTRVDDLRALVLGVQSQGGGWLPLVFHRVCDDCTHSNAIRTEQFEQFVDWLQASEEPRPTVLTVREALVSSTSPFVLKGGGATGPQFIVGLALASIAMARSTGGRRGLLRRSE